VDGAVVLDDADVGGVLLDIGHVALGVADAGELRGAVGERIGFDFSLISLGFFLEDAEEELLGGGGAVEGFCVLQEEDGHAVAG
jgi:hypothetical protein